MIGKHISQVTGETRKIITDRRDGLILPLKTPWRKVNDVIMGGIEWGTLFVLGGMSGSGKTAFAAQLYRELHDLNPAQDFIILFFTFEMTAAKLLLRDIIANTMIVREELLSANGNAILPNQFTSVEAYLNLIKDKEIFFIEEAKTPEEYIEICEEYYIKYKKKVVAFSDHSLLFDGENNDTDRGMLVRLSKAIVRLKNKNWSSHILLSQLNRDIESTPRRIPKSSLNYPQKSDLFASDALYQAADYVMFAHRPYRLKFTGNTYGNEGLSCGVKDTYLHLDKNREGEQALLTMTADFKHMAMIDR